MSASARSPLVAHRPLSSPPSSRPHTTPSPLADALAAPAMAPTRSASARLPQVGRRRNHSAAAARDGDHSNAFFQPLRSFGHDREQLAEQVRSLKVTLSQVKEDRQKLQTKVKRLEAENQRLQKDGTSGANGTKKSGESLSGDSGLRWRLKRMQSELKKKDLELARFRRIEAQEHVLQLTDTISKWTEEIAALKRVIHRQSYNQDKASKHLDRLETRARAFRQQVEELDDSSDESDSEDGPPNPEVVRDTPSVQSNARMSTASPVSIYNKPSLKKMGSSKNGLVAPRDLLRQTSGVADFFVKRNGTISDMSITSVSETQFLTWLAAQDEGEQMNNCAELFGLIKAYRRVLTVSQDISGAGALDEAIVKIVHGAKEVLEAEHVRLFMVDPHSQVLELHNPENSFAASFVKGAQGDLLDKPTTPKRPVSAGPRLVVEFGRGIVGHVAASCVAANVNDASKHPSFDSVVDQPAGTSVRNILCLPIALQSRSSERELVAVLAALNKRSGIFGPQDEVLLNAVAVQAGNTLRHAQLYQQSLRAERKNKALLEVVKAVSNDSDDIDRIIERIIAVTYDALRVDRVTLFLVDTIQKCLVFKVSRDNVTVQIPLGQGIAGHVAASGETVNIPDAYKDSRFDSTVDKKTGYRTKSILCMPITDPNGKPIAVIQCLNKSGGPFNHEDEELLSAFAFECAAVLQRKSLETAYLNLLNTSETGASSNLRAMLQDYTGSMLRQDKDAETGSVNWPQQKGEASMRTAAIRDWGFDPFSKTSEELMSLVVDIFEEFHLIRTFKIEIPRLQAFLIAVRDSYHDNPYHNFVHAFSVLHCCFMVLELTRIIDFLTPLDTLALFLAAIAHDLDHPGKNNNFQVNAATPLALLYNDKAVLESHHASLCFRIIAKPECNLLTGLSPDQFRDLRRLVIDTILATDMGQHSKLTSDLLVQETFSRDKPEDRAFISQIILHAADLSNPILPRALAHRWAEAVLEEFYEQAQVESSRNLPVAPFMLKKDPRSLAQLNANFITYVVAPLWTRLAELFPELKVCTDNLTSNLAAWNEMLGE